MTLSGWSLSKHIIISFFFPHEIRKRTFRFVPSNLPRHFLCKTLGNKWISNCRKWNRGEEVLLLFRAPAPSFDTILDFSQPNCRKQAAAYVGVKFEIIWNIWSITLILNFWDRYIIIIIYLYPNLYVFVRRTTDFPPT